MDSDVIWPHGIDLCICRIPIRKKDGYDALLIHSFLTRLKSHMAVNGSIFLVAYSPVEERARPFEIMKVATLLGFTHVDNIILQKSWYPGKRSEMNLVNSYDILMHFCNGSVWRLDRTPILQYMKLDEDEFPCPGNVWKIETGGLDDAYPADLAELVIKMSDLLPGSTVFDPFMGCSSALSASLKLGHSFYGFESDQKKFKKDEDIVENRVKPKENKASITDDNSNDI